MQSEIRCQRSTCAFARTTAPKLCGKFNAPLPCCLQIVLFSHTWKLARFPWPLTVSTNLSRAHTHTRTRLLATHCHLFNHNKQLELRLSLRPNTNIDIKINVTKHNESEWMKENNNRKWISSWSNKKKTTKTRMIILTIMIKARILAIGRANIKKNSSQKMKADETKNKNKMRTNFYQ